MRLRTILPILALVAGVAATNGCGGKPTVNFGDGTTGNLIYGVFTNWGAGEPDKALVYADRLVEDYGAEAREQQASLSDYPPTDPPEAVFRYAALNAVSAALWAKGEILLEKGDRPAAIAAFTSVVNDYGYAQAIVQGKSNEWWKPAERAQERLDKLAADAN